MPSPFDLFLFLMTTFIRHCYALSTFLVSYLLGGHCGLHQGIGWLLCSMMMVNLCIGNFVFTWAPSNFSSHRDENVLEYISFMQSFSSEDLSGFPVLVD